MTRRLALLAALSIAACSESGPAPAEKLQYQRVVTLAPHLAELVHAVGAGDRLVGVSAYTDYPAAVKDLPVVSDAFTVDQEMLSRLDPDLLLAWESGMPSSTIDQLRQRGFTVEVVRTRSLADIAAAMRRIGELTDATATAEAAAARFEAELEAVGAGYEAARPVRVFVQISDRPLYTVNRGHYISGLVALCGGINIFAELDELAPSVDVEAVVERAPGAILSSGIDPGDLWKRWPSVPAVRAGNIFVLPADETGRPTPRVIVAARATCEALDLARQQLAPNLAPVE